MLPQLLEYAAIIGTLVLMEGLLAADNALVLAVLVSRLPNKHERKRALLYGIVGAFVFRALSLFAVYWLINMWQFKALGAAYLIYITAHYFWSGAYKEQQHVPVTSAEGAGESKQNSGAWRRYNTQFWLTVLMVELTDLAFSVDQIVAAVGLSSDLWVVYAGGMMGIIAMRFAAGGFLVLIERRPKLAYTGHILPAWIGIKLAIRTLETQPFSYPVHMPGWLFWCGMAGLVAWGLLSKASEQGEALESAERTMENKSC
jgi:YkoY family integral membrane protein